MTPKSTMTEDEQKQRRISQLAKLMDCDAGELTVKIDAALAKRDAAKRALGDEA